MDIPFASLIVFCGITVLYIALKQLIGYTYKSKPAPNTRKILLGIYVFAVVVAQYFFNMSLTKSLCGKTQTMTAFLMTVIPNLLMVGTLIMLFAFFPGWKAPFANTIGYLITKLLGVRHLFIELLNTSGHKGGGVPKHGDESHMKKPLIQEIYDDPSLMINEITPEKFDDFMAEMHSNHIIGKGASRYFPQLYKFVTLKDNISEFIWYILVGALVISTSYNALSQISCAQNPAAMLAAHEDWNDEQNNVQKPPTPKIFYDRE